MKRIVLFCSLALVLAGCGYTAEEAKTFNATSINSPEYVGEVQGHRLYRFQIAREGVESIRNHWVYFFADNPVVTINMGEQQGKSTVNQVQVLINGHPIFTTNLLEKP